MSQPDKPEDERASVKKDWQIAVKWLNTSGLRVLIGIAGALTLAIVILAIMVKDPNTSANILTVGILTVLTIVVTTIAAVSNRLMVEIMDRQETEMTNQRIIMERQAKIAKKTLKRSDKNFYLAERAYVGLSNMTVDCFEIGKPVSFRFHIQNGGNTPAFNVRFLMQGLNVTIESNQRKENIPDIVLKYLSKEKWVESAASHLILPGEKSYASFTDTTIVAHDRYNQWETGKIQHCIAIQVIFTDMWGGKERSVVFLNEYSKIGLALVKCYTSDIANTITNLADRNKKPN